MYVYFEVYNVARDAAGSTRYSVEVAIAGQPEEGGLLRRAWEELLGRANEGGVSTRAEYSGTTSETGEYVILDIADLEQGAYTVGVRIVDLNTGETSETQKLLALE
jgi:hypothetical protein